MITGTNIIFPSLVLYELFTFGQMPYLGMTNRKVVRAVTKYAIPSYCLTHTSNHTTFAGDIACLGRMDAHWPSIK